jgi:hypothetical protein
MKFLVPLVFVGFVARGQAPAVSADWEITQTLDAFNAQARRLKPILDQLTPQDWVKKGASETYVAQWRGAEDELGYVVNAAKAFKAQPDKLTLALETLFRMQSLEARVTSLVNGVRGYQNPAIGDLLLSVLGDNSANRDKLRNYVTDLAMTQEQEFQVLEQEAQRCRGLVNRPAPKKKSSNE